MKKKLTKQTNQLNKKNTPNRKLLSIILKDFYNQLLITVLLLF